MGPRPGQSGCHFPMAIVMAESWDPVKSSELRSTLGDVPKSLEKRWSLSEGSVLAIPPLPGECLPGHEDNIEQSRMQNQRESKSDHHLMSWALMCCSHTLTFTAM